MRYRELKEARGVRVYHGSGQDFDHFDVGKLGTGEGGDAFGWGLYFAEHPAVAQFYGDMLGRSSAGRDTHVATIYTVELMAPKAHFLDWDKLLYKQPYIMDALKDVELDPRRWLKLEELPNGMWHWEGDHNQFRSREDAQRLYLSTNAIDGRGVYGRIGWRLGGRLRGNREASEFLASKGIPGLRYLDEGSRAQAKGTHNYVVWDTSIIQIVRKTPVNPAQ